jgi:hypothetical protein
MRFAFNYAVRFCDIDGMQNRRINSEVVMKSKGRATAAVILAAFILAIASQGVANAGTIREIRGVVEFASENALTIRGVVHDIKGAPVVDENEMPVKEKLTAFIGKRASIISDDGKIILVKIFPDLPR